MNLLRSAHNLARVCCGWPENKANNSCTTTSTQISQRARRKKITLNSAINPIRFHVSGSSNFCCIVLVLMSTLPCNKTKTTGVTLSNFRTASCLSSRHATAMANRQDSCLTFGFYNHLITSVLSTVTLNLAEKWNSSIRTPAPRL